MIDSDYNLKLIDLGFGTNLQGREMDGLMRTKLGTPGYYAPEILEGIPYQGSSVDIFALGVTMLIMRTLEYLFGNALKSDKSYMLL